MVKPPEPGNVVEEFMLGSTKIQICDDAFRDQTPEQRAVIDRQIATVCWRIWMEMVAKGKDI